MTYFETDAAQRLLDNFYQDNTQRVVELDPSRNLFKPIYKLMDNLDIIKSDPLAPSNIAVTIAFAPMAAADYIISSNLNKPNSIEFKESFANNLKEVLAELKSEKSIEYIKKAELPKDYTDFFLEAEKLKRCASAENKWDKVLENFDDAIINSKPTEFANKLNAVCKAYSTVYQYRPPAELGR